MATSSNSRETFDDSDTRHDEMQRSAKREICVTANQISRFNSFDLLTFLEPSSDSTKP